MFPKSWYPQKIGKLVRVGPDCDGGYVIPQVVLDKTTLLIGLGVNDDWRFEQQFQKANGCKVICYDHTVNFKFWIKKFALDMVRFRFLEFFKIFKYLNYFDGKKAEHRKIKVGYKQTGSITLNAIVEDYEEETIFLKIDIEGWEYRILEDIVNLKNNVIGFAIEFHDVDLHKDRISDLVSRLSNYSLAHIHGNVYGGVDQNGDPIVIEMTFLHSSYVEDNGDRINENSYPITGLDFSNDPKNNDIELKFG